MTRRGRATGRWRRSVDVTLRAPFPWFGGKSRVAPLVWERFGPVRNYVEPFAGSLAVLLGRPGKPGIETVNDLDCFLANFWRAMVAAPEEVARWADAPVNEADLHARHQWLVDQGDFRERMLSDPDFFDVKVAGWWVWGLSCWIGGGWCAENPWGAERRRPYCSRNSAGMGVHRKRPSVSGTNGGRGVHRLPRRRPSLGGTGGGVGVHSTNRRQGLESLFGEIQERLRGVRVCCGDWYRVLAPAVILPGSGVCGIFLDPPYDPSAGRAAALYSQDGVQPCPWSRESDERPISYWVRRWAIENGDDPRLRIAVCGYEGEHEFPESWDCVSWSTPGGYGLQGKGMGFDNRSRERIWFSPHCLEPLRLFRDVRK